MIETILTLSTGEKIYVYDKVFALWELEHTRDIVESSYFKLGGQSYLSVNEQHSSSFQSVYNQDDVKKLRIYNSNNLKKIVEQHLFNYIPDRQWVNATTHNTDYKFHTDASDITRKSVLVYINTRWDTEWGGETLFRNSNGELEIAVEFKPNRVVLFNSILSHKASQISVKSDAYRFIFVQQFYLQVD